LTSILIVTSLQVMLFVTSMVMYEQLKTLRVIKRICVNPFFMVC